VHECGLASDHPARGVLYSAVFAVAPLDYAGENGLHTVELGCGHPIPKKVRGASQTRLWHVREAGPVGGHR